MKKSQKIWDMLASRYDAQVEVYARAYEKTVARTLKYLNSGDHVLDFACGTGITTLKLAEKVKQIHAVDISGKMIDIARDKAEKSQTDNIRFLVGGLYHEELMPGSFDVVLAFNALYFLNSPEAAVRRISELLRPGGYFISVTDCLGEKKSLKIRIMSLLSRLGVLPSMKLFTADELIRVAAGDCFKVLEKENLHTAPPNLFIAAQKSKNPAGGLKKRTRE